MREAQRYACTVCGDSKFLPENPRTGKLNVRTGCPECVTLRRHYAVGRVS